MNRERRVANIFLLALSALSLALLSLPLSGKVQSLRACVSYLLDPLPFYGSRGIERLASIPADAARLISLDTRNRVLSEQIRETELLRARLEAAERERDRLAGLLGMGLPSGGPLIWARIMERDPVHWRRSVLIDAGRDRGVGMEAPVLGVYGSTLAVIGRIAEVREKLSKVLLLTDELSGIAAYLPSARWEGLLQGQGRSRLRLNYLPVEAAVSPGEKVYTSPTSRTFPPDLLLGSVSRIFERDPFLAFQSVEVEPAADAQSLQEVLILPLKGRAGP